MLESFAQRNRPVLFVDETEFSDPEHLVTTDQFEAGRLATTHLLAQGRRAVLALSFTPGSYRGFELRLDGYRRAHAEAGVPVEERRIQQAWMSCPEHVLDLLRSLQGEGVACDGFFGLADVVALWGMEALQRLNRRVPEDVPVIGIDGLSLGEWSRPQLTSIAQPTQEIGRRAFERVLTWLQTGRDAGGTERLAPALRRRASS
ncbi:MAG: substrate-binding domain-containing protein [Planctomycetota bacterium]|nr:substrate-binding domain-containing protein [Planctomycetota bacterium]